jgi:predicted acyltransferase
MGVFMVNGEHVAAHGLVPGPLWIILSTIGLVLVFAAPEDPDRRGPWRVLRALGLVLLVAAVFLYRTDGGVGLVQMRPRWWGILGLIGWAYLVAAAGYLLARERPAVLLGGVSLLFLVALADESNAIGVLALVRPLVAVGAMLGAHGGLALAGAVLTVALLRARGQDADGRRFVAAALGYAAALAAAGLLLHSLNGLGPAFWINKVKATVPWCLLSAAITVAVWVGGYALADVRGVRRWPRAMTMAGENALLIYLLPDLLLSAFELLEPFFGVNPYAALGRSLAVGTVRSILFAWLVVRLSGWMRDRGLRLHL